MPLLSLPLSAGTCFFEADLNLTGHTFDEGEGAIAFEATGFILQVLITCYACLGLALACDDYFVASLEILIERLALPPDVAGATFMAAGTSSPELFVAAVTVFFPAEEVGANTGELEIHKDPGLGVGTVIGSTMFNTLCIVGGSAIVSGGMVKLDWRIVLRDAGGYAVAIAVLSMCIVDETCDAFSCVEEGPKWSECRRLGCSRDECLERGAGWNGAGWGTIRGYETVVLMAFYAAYVLLCAKYSVLVDRCCARPMADVRFQELGSVSTSSFENHVSVAQMQPKPTPVVSDSVSQWDSARQQLGHQLVGAVLEGEIDAIALDFDLRRDGDGLSVGLLANEHSHIAELYNAMGEPDVAPPGSAEEGQEHAEPSGAGHGHGAKDESCGDTVTHLFRPPGNPVKIAWWLLTLPLMAAFMFTIIDCRNKRYAKYYMVTMAISICWLGVLVWVMVSGLEKMSEMLGMSTVTVGLVFSAAGTSLPDFLSSLIVAHRGQPNMAISNAFGSNIFDMLLGLGVPWFLQLCLVTPGRTLYVGDPGLPKADGSFNNDGLKKLSQSLALLSVTLAIWVVYCILARWRMFPDIGWYMVFCYLFWAGQKLT